MKLLTKPWLQPLGLAWYLRLKVQLFLWKEGFEIWLMPQLAGTTLIATTSSFFMGFPWAWKADGKVERGPLGKEKGGGGLAGSTLVANLAAWRATVTEGASPYSFMTM